MALFDSLPKTLRAALGRSNHPWAPSWAVLVLRKGFPLEAVIARIDQADREMAVRRELQLLRGQG